MPASLARRYDEPVDVERRDGEPAAFVRRRGQDRRYRVRVVLAHWWETGPWWESLERTATESPGVSDDEREVWRVEATGPGQAVAVVELCLSWVTGRWTLAAVLD